MNRLNRKFLTLVLICSCLLGATFAAYAEGYQINAQSARQLGMGHTGVALKLGAEGMLFNPASMPFMDKKWEISLGATGIQSKVKYTNGSYTAKTDNPLGTPIFGYIAYKPTKNLALGVSITNPVGNSIKWPDSWAGADLVQKITLEGYSIQPTLSYKFGDFLSIGAGLMIDFGNFKLSRALIAPGGLDRLGEAVPQLKPAIESFKGEVPVAVTIGGNTKVSFGANIGLLLNLSEKVSIGVSYRSKILFKVENEDAELKYANENVKKVINTVNGVKPGTIVIPPIDEGTFDAELPGPSNVNIGVSYKPTEKLTLTGEVQFVGWKAYDTLTIQFDESVLNGYSIKAEKKYRNSSIIRLGGEYKFNEIWQARLGAYYDMTPVRSYRYNPETPGSNKFTITAGGSFSPAQWISLNVAFAYITGDTRHGTYPIGTDNAGNVVEFSGKYKASAIMPSVGVSFRF